MKTNFPRIKKFIQKSTLRRRTAFVIMLPFLFLLSAALTIIEAFGIAFLHISLEAGKGVNWVKRHW